MVGESRRWLVHDAGLFSERPSYRRGSTQVPEASVSILAIDAEVQMDAEWWCIALSIDLSVLSARVEGPRVTSVVQ